MEGKKINALQEFIEIVNGMKDMSDEEKKATIAMAKKAVQNEGGSENGPEKNSLKGKPEKSAKKQPLFNSLKDKKKK